MACYVDLTVDITRLPNYAKIEQTSDLANALLRGGVDFGYRRKELMDGKTSASNLIFQSDQSRRDQYFKEVKFCGLEDKKQKEHTYLFTIQRAK